MNKSIKFFVGLIISVSAALSSYAGLTLPSVIDSGMVLQRGKEVPVWGWTDAGQEVTVEFAGQSKTAMSNEEGRWQVLLDPLEASSIPGVMQIESAGETLTLDDILVGEVWLAAGQSNMEWTFAQIMPEERDYAVTQISNTQIRVFHVEQHLTAGYPLDDTVGRWKTCADILQPPHRSTSAVGFFFALKLYQELGIPVATIDANWGGQRIECFIPDEGYNAFGLPFRRGPAGPNPGALRVQLDQATAEIERARAALDEGRMVALFLNPNVHGWAENFIYNAMIAPVVPYAIKGAIWYQGESNRGNPDYFEKLKALSYGWSQAFNIENIPLYQVQIAPFQYGLDPKDTVISDNIWKAQYRAADEIPGVGVVAIHDAVENVRDIHPRHKRIVGERLAALAMNRQYGMDVPDLMAEAS